MSGFWGGMGVRNSSGSTGARWEGWGGWGGGGSGIAQGHRDSAPGRDTMAFMGSFGGLRRIFMGEMGKGCVGHGNSMDTDTVVR